MSARSATCKKCGADNWRFYGDGKRYCRTCKSSRSEETTEKARATNREWRRKNPRKSRALHLRTRYGLNFTVYEAMLVAQVGRCALCEAPLTGPREPQVDHDHTTGGVRGLVCSSCNRGLGSFEKPGWAEKAAAYLKGGLHVAIGRPGHPQDIFNRCGLWRPE